MSANGTGEKAGPLSGIRVLELALYFQGPIVGAVLGFLGAEVIKIEPPSGGRSRPDAPGSGVSNLNASPLGFWSVLNANKESVVVDLANPDQRPALEELIRSADVFITNLRQRTLENLHVDKESVLAINPQIVYARAGGLGEKGPLAELPCQDTIGMAYAGMMDSCSPWENEPYYAFCNMSDVLSGTMLAFGVVTSLLGRERGHDNLAVATSQLQSLLWLQVHSVTNAATSGERPIRHDRQRPDRHPLLSMYEASDGDWLALGLVQPHQWEEFAPLIGHVEALADPRFASFALRQENTEALSTLVASAIKERPRQEWLDLFYERGIWCGPVNRIMEMHEDPQVKANDIVGTLEDGTRTVMGPFSLDGYEPPKRRAPALGSWPLPAAPAAVTF